MEFEVAVGGADVHSRDGWSMTAMKPMKSALVFNNVRTKTVMGLMRISC